MHTDCTPLQEICLTDCNMPDVVPDICHLIIVCSGKGMIKAAESHVILRGIETAQAQIIPHCCAADTCTKQDCLAAIANGHT